MRKYFRKTISVVLAVMVVLSTIFVCPERSDGQNRVHAGGVFEWVDVYIEFLQNRDYLSMGQDYGSEVTVMGKFFDMDHDGLPEILIDNGYNGSSVRASYVYSYMNGKVVYLGVGPSAACYDTADERLSDLFGYSSDTTNLTRYIKSGDKIIERLESIYEETGGDFNEDGKYGFIMSKYISELINELEMYSAFTGVTDYQSNLPLVFVEWEELIDRYDFCTAGSFYDPEDIDNTLPFILKDIVTHPSLAELYGKGIDLSWGNDGKKDPQGRFEAYYSVSEEQAEFVAKQIYNISDEDYTRLLDKLLSGQSGRECYKENGRIYSFMGGVGGPGIVINFKEVHYDRGFFYVTYNTFIDSGEDYMNYPDRDVRTFCLAEKEYEGRKYWSVYGVKEGGYDQYGDMPFEVADLRTNIGSSIDYPGGNVYVTLNEEMFMQDNKEYHKDISTLAVSFAMAAYDDGYDNLGKGEFLYEAYRRLGFLSKDIALYSYPNNANGLNKTFDERFKDNDLAFSIASRWLDDYMLVVVDFRGTASNMDVIKDASIWAKNKNFYGTDNAYSSFHDFWEDYTVAVNNYYFSHDDVRKAGEEGKIILLVTGHSLGAAAANLTGKAANMGNAGVEVSEDKIFVYTYACPNVSKTVSKDKNIFNIVNKSDVVPDIPADYRKYGNNLNFKSSDPYGMDGHCFDRYVNAVVDEDVKAPGVKEKKNKVKYFSAHCPVDMEVRKDGKLFGEIVDNVITANGNESYFYVEGDEKIFFPPDDDIYEITLTAYDDGMMDVFVCSSDDRNYSMKDYLDVELKKGDIFTSKIGDPSVVSDSILSVEHGNGNTDKVNVTDSRDGKIEADEETAGKTGKSRQWILLVVLAASLILILMIVIIVLHSKKRKKSAKMSRQILNTQQPQIMYAPLKMQSFQQESQPFQQGPQPEPQQMQPVQQGSQPVSQQPTQSRQPMEFAARFCGKCGAQLDSKQRYCVVCGAERS